MKVGIVPRGGQNWIAGVIYIQNLVRAIDLLSGDEKPALYFVLSCSDGIGLYRDLGQCLPPLKRYAFRGTEPLASRITGALKQARRFQRPISFERLLKSLNLTAIFPVKDWMHQRSHCKGIGWIPDFQHKHLPQFFSKEEVLSRDEEFRNIIRYSAHTVVSSRRAYEDLMRWFPSSRTKVSVFPFVSVPCDSWYEGDPREVIKRCGVPSKYLIFPSQFWIHKNHQRLFEAIRIVRQRFPDIALVCTGRMYDYRRTDYGKQLLAMIKNQQLQKNVYCLGLLDRLTQIQLVRGAAAVVQPSLFEGWSALVEDAQALGKSLYLSDIPIHREQSPSNAKFFNPLSSDELAASLENDWEALTPGPDRAREQRALPLQQARALEYARSFLKIVREASTEC